MSGGYSPTTAENFCADGITDAALIQGEPLGVTKPTLLALIVIASLLVLMSKMEGQSCAVRERSLHLEQGIQIWQQAILKPDLATWPWSILFARDDRALGGALALNPSGEIRYVWNGFNTLPTLRLLDVLICP